MFKELSVLAPCVISCGESLTLRASYGKTKTVLCHHCNKVSFTLHVTPNGEWTVHRTVYQNENISRYCRRV